MASGIWAAAPAWALDCAFPPPAEQVERADVVLVGTIVSMTRPLNEGTGEAGALERTVKVERYLKGSGPDDLFFFPSDLVWWEGLGPSAAGHEFLLFLFKNGPVYRTSVCRGNAYLGDERGRQALQEILAVTGRLTQAEGDAAADPPALLSIAGAGILALAVVGAGVVAVRVRPRTSD